MIIFIFALVFLLSACTDYVGQIDDQIDELHAKAALNSSSSVSLSVSSGSKITSSSSKNADKNELPESSETKSNELESSSSFDLDELVDSLLSIPHNPPVKNETDRVYIMFKPPWSNTNALMYVNGESQAMTPMDNYCGWFSSMISNPGDEVQVYFKQTVGSNFVGAEGVSVNEPDISTEIHLDSVAAISDTVWVLATDAGKLFISHYYPQVLGDCPVKRLPVVMFDWLHGSKGDSDKEGRNGDPANGISADFGSGGCSGSPMRGMVDTQLGVNGVPVPATPFPENCKITDHLAYWFTPESLAVDGQGNTLTNMTCRDLYISMDSEGFWLAEISKDAISKGNEANRGGMFLLDDFEYLDDACTVPNPYFDQLRGGSDSKNHNFGFTMKVQATFEYIPGQYFDFLGDDDVWVFINNKLVVDIGGQHAQVAGAVNLDTLGLTVGEIYPFHIFYAERHTSSSNFRMHTSIDLKSSDDLQTECH